MRAEWKYLDQRGWETCLRDTTVRHSTAKIGQLVHPERRRMETDNKIIEFCKYDAMTASLNVYTAYCTVFFILCKFLRIISK